MSNTTNRNLDVKLARQPDECFEELHVIIAHDDHPAYVRAVRMLANTFFGHPEAAAVRPLPWRFDDLRTDAWRKRAMADIPRVDIIVISASACRELPEGVNLWLGDCCAARRNMPTAVIALCDSLNDREAPWRHPLREIVTMAGLDFLEGGPPAQMSAAGAPFEERHAGPKVN